jgi:DNA-binding transcriptional ArsR family regulator
MREIAVHSRSERLNAVDQYRRSLSAYTPPSRPSLFPLKTAALDMQAFACLYFMQQITCILPLMPPNLDDPDLLFKALADPSRRKLLDALHANDGQTLNDLCEHLDMTRQGVTQHLSVLEAANLVATTWRGREKLHFLNPVPLQQIYERWIAKFEKPRLKALSNLKRRLEKPNE